MEFSGNRVVKITLMLVFLSCMLFANFIAVRMMFRYGVDAYFYDKLLVAYTVGGDKGLKLELSTIPITDKLRRESILAREFSGELARLKDPRAFLADKVQKSKKMASFIRDLRNAAILVMLILFGWQLIMGRINAAKRR
jgi:hypothetical protein